MAKINRRDSGKPDYYNSDKVAWKFDVKSLDTMLTYAMHPDLRLPDLARMQKLIMSLDMDAYKFNLDLYNRINLLKLILEAKVDKKLSSNDTIRMYISNSDAELFELYNKYDWPVLCVTLTVNDIRMIATSIVEKLQYGTLMANKEKILENYEHLEQSGFYSMSDNIDDMRRLLATTVQDMQKIKIEDGMIRELNLSEPMAINTINKIVEKSKKPKSTLLSGSKMLNINLGGGFQSRRLYVFLGNTGGFKSGLLLNLADQIHRYNTSLLSSGNTGKRKVILFITMENSIDETIERLYEMYSDDSSAGILSALDGDEVNRVLCEKGLYVGEDKPAIDIIFRYYSSMEISTQDLYPIVQNLEDQNKEVIAIILDYMKKIDTPKKCGTDERIRLGYVAQELKAVAQYFDIPLITAMQTNREANMIIDAAIKDNQTDVARLVGASQIGSSWAIMEEADWVCLIQREERKKDHRMFLTFKRLKIRGKSDDRVPSYFNQPFEGTKAIKLVSDVNTNQCSSVWMLNDDKSISKDESSRHAVVHENDPNWKKTKQMNLINEITEMSN